MHRKVILLGDTTVGKSSIINRRMNNTFNQSIPNTIGTAFFKQSFRREGVLLEMSIWDTCGQEQFMAISTVYYRDSHVILLVIDCTSADSLEMARIYLEEIENNADPKSTVFLCINKIDLLGEREFEGEKVGYSEVYIDSINDQAYKATEGECEFFSGSLTRNPEDEAREQEDREDLLRVRQERREREQHVQLHHRPVLRLQVHAGQPQGLRDFQQGLRQGRQEEGQGRQGPVQRGMLLDYLIQA